MLRPHLLPPDPIDHEYDGGDLIATLRGGPGGPRRPEEWLGSVTTRWGQAPAGISVVDGTPLTELIAADPEGWLGADHVARFGTSTAVLVKLIHAGQRLPVHVHPDREFAARHLDCPFGKSEAWLVLDRDRPGTDVFVGTHRRVDHGEWSELVAAQDTDTMLSLLNPVAVEPGDTVFVPAGTPHAIGEGLLILELQEPTDFSILCEWEGFGFDGPNDGHLGLGFDVALSALDPGPLDDAALDALIRRADLGSARNGLSSAFVAAADPFFRLNRAAEVPGGVVTLPASFGILVVTEGSGSLSFGGEAGAEGGDTAGSMPITRGEAYVVPHGCGPLTLSATEHLVAYFSTPPDPIVL